MKSICFSCSEQNLPRRITHLRHASGSVCFDGIEEEPKTENTRPLTERAFIQDVSSLNPMP
jgi:hypothetical protein